MLNVLIGCEYSGVIRDAFGALGHNAWSCDLLPSDNGGKHHIGDVREILNSSWDLFIAHPPCTYLSNAGNSYWYDEGRARKRLDALLLFLDLWEAPVKHICIENPMGIADRMIAKHTQIIHPYYFGDGHMKRTCLWLKNLPLLQYQLHDDLFGEKTAADKPEPIYVDKSGKKRYFTDAISGTRNGGHKRSKSFPGVAAAMAEQWTEFINKLKK